MIIHIRPDEIGNTPDLRVGDQIEVEDLLDYYPDTPRTNSDTIRPCTIYTAIRTRPVSYALTPFSFIYAHIILYKRPHHASDALRADYSTIRVQIGNTVRVRVGEPSEVLDLLEEWRCTMHAHVGAA